MPENARKWQKLLENAGKRLENCQNMVCNGEDLSRNMNKNFSKDVGPYSDGKIEWQSVEGFWTDFEAQEGIIWGTGGSYDIDLKTGPFLDHLTVIIKERL